MIGYPLARHWIDGEWVQGARGTRFPSLAPATGAILGEAADGGAEEARASIAAARRVFDAGSWDAEPRLRAAVLLELAQRLESDGAELAELLCAENGKVLRECVLEVEGAASELRYYAGIARAAAGRSLEVAPGVTSLLSHEAAGVAGIIVPWNAPLTLLARSLGPALAAGCTVVIKAAPQTALFSYRVLQHLAKVEKLPRGVVNLLFERGNAAAEELTASPDVDVLSYTGSTRVGRKIMAAAAETLKRLSLELGGKAAAIVCDDADLGTAVPEILAAGTILSGQQCTAVSRVLVHESVQAEFRRHALALLESFRVGFGNDPASQMGAVIDAENRDRIDRLVEEAAGRHAVLFRGRKLRGIYAQGAFIAPSLIECRDVSSALVQDEHFGPVMTLERFEDDRQAVAMANATRFGLASSVWTRDSARARRMARRLRCGTVWVNAHNKLFAEAETGGYRDSGFGRLHGVEGMNDFLQTKHVYQQIGTL